MPNNQDTMQPQEGEFFPAEYSNRGMVNFMPSGSGFIHRIAATKNAVVIQIFDELRNDDGSFRTTTHVECKDADMKEPLLELAKSMLAARQKPVLSEGALIKIIDDIQTDLPETWGDLDDYNREVARTLLPYLSGGDHVAELRRAMYPGGCKHPQQGTWEQMLHDVQPRTTCDKE